MAAGVLYPCAASVLLACEFDNAGVNHRLPDADEAFCLHSLGLQGIPDGNKVARSWHNVLRKLSSDENNEKHPGVPDFGDDGVYGKVYWSPADLRHLVALQMFPDEEACGDFAANCWSQIDYMHRNQEKAASLQSDCFLRKRRSFSNNKERILNVFVELQEKRARDEIR